MTTHQKLLEKLIKLENPAELSSITDDLEAFDAAGVAAVFDIDDISDVLHRYLKSELTADDVALWAAVLSSRQDIDFAESEDDGVLLDILDELANPLIEGELTPEKARQLLDEIS